MRNKHHQEIAGRIKKFAKKRPSFYLSPSYSGSSHSRHGLSVPESRAVAKEWAREHHKLSLKEFLTLLAALYSAQSVDEKKIASHLLALFPAFRKQIDPKRIERWLDHLEGWEEIDSLCQSVFTAEEMLASWVEWKKVFECLACSKKLTHRRASLVLLTGPVARSSDPRLALQAFSNIEKLQGARNILITKAVSWLLRELIRHHRGEIEKFTARHSATLPKVAIRETIQKLRKGKK